MLAAAGAVRSVGLANQQVSYWLAGGPQSVYGSQSPAPLRALADDAEATGIGTAYAGGLGLVGLVAAVDPDRLELSILASFLPRLPKIGPGPVPRRRRCPAYR